MTIDWRKGEKGKYIYKRSGVIIKNTLDNEKSDMMPTRVQIDVGKFTKEQPQVRNEENGWLANKRRIPCTYSYFSGEETLR